MATPEDSGKNLENGFYEECKKHEIEVNLIMKKRGVIRGFIVGFDSNVIITNKQRPSLAELDLPPSIMTYRHAIQSVIPVEV
jgi:sRNA-binding regulator protein Hfq